MEKTLRKVSELVTEGFVDSSQEDRLAEVVSRFSLAITPTMANLINRENPLDPIALQFVPKASELDFTPEELLDPTDDLPLSPVKGLVHRYPDRVLFKPTHTCPIYCRFCFRREQVGAGSEALSEADLAQVYDYIRNKPEIWEVVVSGGDPLILSPRRLAEIMRELNSIPHVGVIRFHTRVPIVDPGRVNEALIAALECDKSVWVVLHANHPQEFSAEARAACKTLRLAGIPMLSQSALLKGINDDPDVLTRLFRQFITMGVKPYYLHHGDLAQGTSHFRTSIETGQNLMKRLRGRVSGICQPTYILDIPNAHGKVPIGHTYVVKTSEDSWRVEDIDGNHHVYPPR